MEYLVNGIVEMFVLGKPFPKIIKTVYHKFLYLQMFLLGNFYYVVGLSTTAGTETEILFSFSLT